MSAIVSDTTTQSREAFDATAAERATVDLTDAGSFRLDAIFATMTAAATVKRLGPYLVSLKALPGIDAGKIERFGTYARALYCAQTTLVARANREKAMPALASEGWKLRDILFKYADLLVATGKFPEPVLARFKAGTGYADLVEDLGGLANWFRGAPELTGPGAPVTVDVVARAEQLAITMNDQAGLDHDMDLSQADLLVERHKLAVLLLAAHREVRRGLEYLRFYEGDAASIAPTLYPTGKGKRPAAQEEAEVEPMTLAEHEAAHAVEEHNAPADPADNPFAGS